MEILLLFAVITAAIWACYLVPRFSLLLLCGVYLIVASTFGYDFFNFQAGITLSLDRILLVGIVGCFGWHWLNRRSEARDMPASEWLLLGFLGLLVVNTLAYDWRRNTPDQVPILQHLIEGYIIPSVLYWIARRSVIKQKNIDALYLIFGLFGVYLSLTALCEVTGLWALVFPRQIADPDLGIHFGRARGPYLQSVRMGIYLLVCLFASWVPLVWRGVWGRAGQLLGFVLFGLHTAAIVATFTRSVWVGLALAAAFVAVMTFPPRLKRGAIVAMVVMTLLVSTVLHDGLLSIKRESGPLEAQQSSEMRAVFAYVSWLMFKDRPLAGCGFGHFPHKNSSYLNDRSTTLELETIRGYTHHNTFLSLLVELGIVGFVLYCSLLAAWGQQAYRLWKDQSAELWMRGQAFLFVLLLYSYMVQMAFHDMSYSPVENGLLFMMAGITSGIYSMHSAPATSPAWLRNPFRRFAHLVN